MTRARVLLLVILTLALAAAADATDGDAAARVSHDERAELRHLRRVQAERRQGHRLFAYLLKYITKPETASTALAEVMTATDGA